MKRAWPAALGLYACAFLIPNSLRGGERADVRPEVMARDRTSDAIDAGIDYLLPMTQRRLEAVERAFPSGPVTPTQENAVGRLAFEIYALVVAGVTVEHPTIKKSFEVLSKMQFAHTYSVALYIFALDAAISQLEDDIQMLQPRKARARVRDDPNIGAEYRPRLQAAVESFISSQSKNPRGVWRYVPASQDFDNSNVQFAVLALGVGAKRGITMDSSVWLKVMNHFIKCQQEKGPEVKDRLTMKPLEERGMKRDDVRVVKQGGSKKATTGKAKKDDAEGRTGVATTAPKTDDPEIGTESIQVFQRGWDYEGKGGATWNMTCAGLSSLLLARENLRSVLEPDQKQALDRAIWDGFGWVMANWSFAGNYYGMYSLEKVGDIGEVAKFGSHDWYKEMSEHLLGAQKADGSWPKGAHAEDDPIATSYALLILNRATSLLAMDRTNKIVLSGRKGSGEGQADRSWVYIPDLDTSMHAPSLLRAVRNRPNSPKLVRFLEKIVENYDQNYRGEIVPDLVSARDAVQNKALQKIIDEYLVKITGHQYDDPEQYMKWTRRWARVMQMGESMDPKYKDDLLKYYAATEQSIPLKRKVMWAIGQCKVREAIPLFLEDLKNPNPIVRREAYSRYKDFFIDLPPPFDAEASPEVREKQVAAIVEWNAKQR